MLKHELIYNCDPLEIDVDKLMESSEPKIEEENRITVRMVGDSRIDVTTINNTPISVNRPSWGGRVEAKPNTADDNSESFRCGR